MVTYRVSARPRRSFRRCWRSPGPRDPHLRTGYDEQGRSPWDFAMALIEIDGFPMKNGDFPIEIDG